MSNREPFLARVRQAADQGRQYRVHIQQVPDEIGYLGAGDDLVERFLTEVNAVGGRAIAVGDLTAARQQLQMLLAEVGATSAVCWQHELLERLGLSELLATASVTEHRHATLATLSGEEQRARLLACDIGITSCDCAIAETGTLMMLSRAGQERVASLLPPTHIAIVEQRQIVPDLIDGFRLLYQEGIPALPSNVTFITGPSKTGDIELQLTTGVHGPRQWWVMVIREP